MFEGDPPSVEAVEQRLIAALDLEHVRTLDAINALVNLLTLALATIACPDCRRVAADRLQAPCRKCWQRPARWPSTPRPASSPPTRSRTCTNGSGRSVFLGADQVHLVHGMRQVHLAHVTQRSRKRAVSRGFRPDGTDLAPISGRFG
jgi:hypothetical protein